MERQDHGWRGEYRDLSKLSLEELLDHLAQAAGDEAYAEALEQEILAREANFAAFFPDVEEQWAQFQAQYLPMAEKEELTDWDALLDIPAPDAEVPDPVPRAPVPRPRRIWRTAVAAIIAAACMAAVMLSGQAIGVDVFGARLRWTGDLLPFGQDVSESREEMLLDKTGDRLSGDGF